MTAPIREQVVAAFATRLNDYFVSRSISFARARRTTGVDADVVMWAPVDSDVQASYKKTAATIEIALEYREPLDDLALVEQQAHVLLADLIRASMDLADPTLGGLAHSVQYAGAEIEYPQSGSSMVGVTAVIAIRYQFQTNDPFSL